MDNTGSSGKPHSRRGIHSARPPKRNCTHSRPLSAWQMPKGGAAPDERELRRLALAVRMYQEGRPHWELPAGERHSRVWEWVWCAAEWALWMLLLLWDLLSRGALSSTARPPPVSPPPASTPQNRFASASTRRVWCPRLDARVVCPRAGTALLGQCILSCAQLVPQDVVFAVIHFFFEVSISAPAGSPRIFPPLAPTRPRRAPGQARTSARVRALPWSILPCRMLPRSPVAPDDSRPDS